MTLPRMSPYFRIACSVYMEQDGSNRQEPRKKGESRTRYSRMSPTPTRFTE
jgi:hypothetical protein